MPLNHTRAKRLVVYLALFGLASALITHPVQAVETAAVLLNSNDVRWGKTLAASDGAKAGIFPEALTGPAAAQWTRHEANIPPLPTDRKLLGSVYRLEITGAGLRNSHPRPLAVAIPFGSSHWIRQVWVYDLAATRWTPLATTLNSDRTLGQAAPRILRGLYAILEDRNQQEGIASWYCRLSCSARYPRLHAASNDFPIGTMVRVRSLETWRSTDVKVVSTWGQPAGRVIDLSWEAYAALGASNAGVTPVNVQPVTASAPQVLGATSNYDPNAKIEVIPKLRLVGNSGLPFPTIRPRPFAVYDQTTNQLLAWHRKDDVASIASITKLMTAAVFLDTKPNLRDVITYQSSDADGVRPFDYLHVAPGDTMQLRDLFYSMLVGSANNAATALARSTGLAREEFVARMNAKAKAWGLGLTNFVDVHGLDTRNVSTAEEVARMTAQILHEYEPVRYVTIRREYSFTTINTGVPHRMVTTDKLLGSGLVDNAQIITGGKTGYLDEAKYTYTLRSAAKDNGRQVVTVLLGSASSSERFNDAAAVTNWAYRNHRWEP